MICSCQLGIPLPAVLPLLIMDIPVSAFFNSKLTHLGRNFRILRSGTNGKVISGMIITKKWEFISFSEILGINRSFNSCMFEWNSYFWDDHYKKVGVYLFF